jgi:hypothetical protein
MSGTRQHPEIQILEANKLGCDFIIGDLHGHKEMLQHIVSTLTPLDRLFIAGDMVDRGPDSLGVIEYILELQQQHANGLVPAVFAVRGNHEAMFLGSIQDFEDNLEHFIHANASFNLIETIDDLPEQFFNNLVIHVQECNGGRWIVPLVQQEIIDKKMYYHDGEVWYRNDSQIKKLKDFCESAPYVIHVKSRSNVSAFNVVHADLPFEDYVIKIKHDNRVLLSKEEINHIIWSRPRDYMHLEHDRDANSSLVYCGHCPVLFPGYDPVRKKMNTINIDSLTYLTHGSLVVNHTLHQVALSNPKNKVINRDHALVLNEACDQINQHFNGLKNGKLLTNLRRQLKDKKEEVSTTEVVVGFVKEHLLDDEAALVSFSLYIVNQIESCMPMRSFFWQPGYSDLITIDDILTQQLANYNIREFSNETHTNDARPI